jgi:uncharacterized coiled-coil protein SlyX
MAEFAAAASIIGVIDFGLTVCGKLLEIYNNAKDAQDDIHLLYGSALSLKKVFTVLHNTISRLPSDSEAIPLLQGEIASCQAGLNKLNKKLDKVQKYSANPASLNLQFRLRYAFSQKTISKLNRIVVDDLLARMHVAISCLQL